MRARQHRECASRRHIDFGVGAKLNHGVCKAVRALDEQHTQPAEPYDFYHRRRAFDTSRVGAWSALFGSAVYLCVFTIEGCLRPGYDAASMFISELSLDSLGLGPNSRQIYGLWPNDPRVRDERRLGVWRHKVSARRRDAACDHGDQHAGLGTLRDRSRNKHGPAHDQSRGGCAAYQMSFHSKFHYALGTLFFFAGACDLLLFCWLQPIKQGSGLAGVSAMKLGLGIVSVTGVVLFKVALLPPASNPLLPWRGLVQRATVIPFLVWLFIFGLMMLKHVRLARSLRLLRAVQQVPRRRRHQRFSPPDIAPCNLDIPRLRTDHPHANRGKRNKSSFASHISRPGVS